MIRNREKNPYLAQNQKNVTVKLKAWWEIPSSPVMGFCHPLTVAHWQRVRAFSLITALAPQGCSLGVYVHICMVVWWARRKETYIWILDLPWDSQYGLQQVTSSNLSFLNSKMGMVTTVLCLFFKVIGKLPWDHECETLNKLQSALVRECCTSTQPPGLQRTCRIPLELGSVAELSTQQQTRSSERPKIVAVTLFDV